MNRTWIGAAIALAIVLGLSAYAAVETISPLHLAIGVGADKHPYVPHHKFKLGSGLQPGNSNPGFTTGQIPSAAQWNQIFSGKFDYAGGLLGGALGIPASSALSATFNIIPGTAPVSPNNGDIWTTSAGIFTQVNGSTVGPLGTGGSTGLNVGSTAITGGMSGYVEFNNAGVLGEIQTNGSGNVVLSNSPTLTNPNLGVPSFLTLTNATGLPPTGLTGLGTGVATALGQTANGGAGGIATISTASPTANGCMEYTSSGLVVLTSACGSGGGGGAFPLTVSGVNSGGIPYFNSTTSESSSAALAANSLMIGGGAGVAPSTVSTGLNVLTTLAAAVNSTGGIISPTPSAAGDLPYWNGSIWTKLTGNSSGTVVLSESSAGVPSWSPFVSSVSTTCPVSGPSAGAVTLNNGAGTWIPESGSFTASCGNFYLVTVSSPTTISIPVTAGTLIPAIANNKTSTGTVTLAPVSGLIDGVASETFPAGETISAVADGTNVYTDLNPSSGGGGSTHATNIITITPGMSPYSYTPTTGMVADDVYCIGGGGGGGSGAYVTSGTSASGGAGGSSSVGAYGRFTAAQIGAGPITVTVGAGGAGGSVPAGGSSGAWTQSAGGNGGAGGNSTFGSLLLAGGGGGSAGGQINAAAGSGSTGAYTSAGSSATGSTGTSLNNVVVIGGINGNATLTLPGIFQGSVGGGGINGAI